MTDRLEILAVIAQQDAATAAIFSSVGTIASVLLIVWTLSETRKTTRAAIESSREARRSADLAAETLDHSKAVSAIEIAPYLAIFESSIGLDATSKPVITISYRNFGKGPAKNVQFIYGVRTGYAPVLEPKLTSEGGAHPILAPDQAYSEKLYLRSAGDAQLEEIENGLIIVLVAGLEWETMSGQKQSLIQTLVVDSTCIRTQQLRMPMDMEVLPS